MQEIAFDGTFEGWVTSARAALRGELSPDRISWANPQTSQAQLFEAASLAPEAGPSNFRVPKRFLELSRWVSCHRSEIRWQFLYRALWRLTHGEPQLLNIAMDPDTYELLKMEKSVHHDVHKMRAFVRFREVTTDTGAWFVAWYQPDHYIVPLNAEFFHDRFASMHWSILTPDECLHWDGTALRFSEGVDRSAAPAEDEVEDLWRTYYRNTFNPARLKVSTMKQHMPRRFWKEMPETRDIPAMIAESALQTNSMINISAAKSPATKFTLFEVPTTTDLSELARAAQSCRGCPLWKDATCAVFGEGPRDARVLVVGEQPGDQEDRAGKPFIGPAGQLLNRAFAAAGINRDELYLTNSVKHFKWTPRGKRRLHAKPSAREAAACRPWLEAEINIVQPDLIVCLGGTAARTISGEEIRVTELRGQSIATEFGAPALITLHPSALLRLPDGADPDVEFTRFVEDLKKIVPFLHATQ